MKNILKAIPFILASFFAFSQSKEGGTDMETIKKIANSRESIPTFQKDETELIKAVLKQCSRKIRCSGY